MRRALAALLAAALLPPPPAAAATIARVVSARPLASIPAPLASAGAIASPRLGTLSALPHSAALGVAAEGAKAEASAAPSSHQRLLEAGREVEAFRPAIETAAGEQATSAISRQFSLMLGETETRTAGLSAAHAAAAERAVRKVALERGAALEPAAAPAAAPVPAPAAPATDVVKDVRRMMYGTAVMKVGMEAVKLSVPLMAMAALGGPAMVAVLAVADNVSQAIMAGATAQLARRFSPQKVLAFAIAAQAAIVAGIAVTAFMGGLSLWTLLPLYVLAGAAAGVSETARRAIPARLLGQDQTKLESYNAGVHIRYEIAGVTAAAAIGFVLAYLGPQWTLLIQIPAYALAAWMFFKVRLPAEHAPPPPPKDGEKRTGLGGYLRDVKRAGGILWASPLLRLAAFAYVLPHVFHKLFENVLIPVFAKKVMGDPSAAGYLTSASNGGELLGALLLSTLIRFGVNSGGPARWLALSGLGLAAFWAFIFMPTLLPLLAATVVLNAAWAAGDLKMLSYIQDAVEKKSQERVMGALYAAIVVSTAAVSLSLGWILSVAPLSWAFAGIGVAATALAAWLLWVARKVPAELPPSSPSDGTVSAAAGAPAPASR